MEAKKDIVVVITALIIVLLVYFCVSFIKSKNYDIENNLIVDETYELKDIIIKSNASNINIKESTNEVIKVKIYGDESRTTIEDYDKLKIESNIREFKFFNVNKAASIEIEIPENFDNKITIDGDYSKINIGNYAKAIFDIDVDAGKIIIGNASELKLDVNASDVRISKVNRKLDIEVDAGNVEIEELNLLENSKIIVDAGNVEIGNTNKININAKVELGQVDVKNSYSDSEVTLDIKVDLGNISVKN